MAFNPRKFLLSQNGTVFPKHCILCDVPFDNIQHCSHHLNSADHRHRSDQLRDEQLLIQSLVVKHECVQLSFEPRIAQLSCSNWQNKVRAELLTYLMMDEFDTATNTRLKAITHILERFEHLERVSLLEQVAWRSVCLMNPACKTYDPMYHFQWFQQGWKDRKAELRHASAIAVVMKSVVPFLGKDSKE